MYRGGDCYGVFDGGGVGGGWIFAVLLCGDCETSLAVAVGGSIMKLPVFKRRCSQRRGALCSPARYGALGVFNIQYGVVQFVSVLLVLPLAHG